MKQRFMFSAVLARTALLGSVASSHLAFAQDGREPQSTTPRIVAVGVVSDSAIVVDGNLNELAWQGAPMIGKLTQRVPTPGAPGTERTEVRLLHDDKYLYIGVTCFDSEPKAVIGTQMVRDAALGDDDRIEIVLDTFHDGRNAFYFATNPAGALVDGLVVENRDLNLDWDAIWEVRTARTDAGWTAEFAIPFKSLRFRAGQPVWGFNVSRTTERKLEEDRWAGARLDANFLQVSEAGEITGLGHVSQGFGLDVRPFFTAHSLHRQSSGATTTTGDPGLDVFFRSSFSIRFGSKVAFVTPRDFFPPPAVVLTL